MLRSLLADVEWKNSHNPLKVYQYNVHDDDEAKTIATAGNLEWALEKEIWAVG